MIKTIVAPELLDKVPTREELYRSFFKWHWARPSRNFVLARMNDVVFGVIDPDRGSTLGLKFEINILGGGACAALHLPINESLAMIKKHGSADDLEGKICWVLIEGSGCSSVRFVCLEEDTNQPGFNPFREKQNV